MTSKPKQIKSDPQDECEAGKGLNLGQIKALDRVIKRIGKGERSEYRGARSTYSLLPGEG